VCTITLLCHTCLTVYTLSQAYFKESINLAKQYIYLIKHKVELVSCFEDQILFRSRDQALYSVMRSTNHPIVLLCNAIYLDLGICSHVVMNLKKTSRYKLMRKEKKPNVYVFVYR